MKVSCAVPYPKVENDGDVMNVVVGVGYWASDSSIWEPSPVTPLEGVVVRRHGLPGSPDVLDTTHVPRPELKSWRSIENDGLGAYAVNTAPSPAHTVAVAAGVIVVEGSGLMVASTVLIQPVGSI